MWCFASHWPEMNDVCSGGWDGCVAMWDIEQGLKEMSHIKWAEMVLPCYL